MAQYARITADAPERAGRRAPARSAHRGEADRARAIPMALDGRTAPAIAAGLGVHAGSVREWRGRFVRGRDQALKRRKPPGRPGRVGARAADLAEAVLAGDAGHESGRTLPPRPRAEIERRGGPQISAAWLAGQPRNRGPASAGPGTR